MIYAVYVKDTSGGYYITGAYEPTRLEKGTVIATFVNERMAWDFAKSLDQHYAPPGFGRKSPVKEKNKKPLYLHQDFVRFAVACIGKMMPIPCQMWRDGRDYEKEEERLIPPRILAAMREEAREQSEKASLLDDE